MRFIFISVFSIFSIQLQCQNIVELNNAIAEQTVIDKISPPLASRTIAYCNLAYYYGLHYNSITSTNLINTFLSVRGIHQNSLSKLYCKDSLLLARVLFLKTAQQLSYTNEDWSKQIQTILQKLSNEDINQYDAIFKDIQLFIRTDSFHNRLSYKRYETTNGIYRYKYTPPTFKEPVENNWGYVRCFLLSNKDEYIQEAFYLRNNIKDSFDKDNKSIYDKSKKLSDEEKKIAMFWDCNPMITKKIGHAHIVRYRMTPAAHWIMISTQLDEIKKLSTELQSLFYATLTMSMADAFIVCWDSKYRNDFIRPVSYIQTTIDATWNPYIETPQFPEYPSGHSLVSSTAAYILTKTVGDSIQYIDRTQSKFIGYERSYTSFTKAAEEAGYSRWLGGIHYLSSIQEAYSIGLKLARDICEKTQY